MDSSAFRIFYFLIGIPRNRVKLRRIAWNCAELCEMTRNWKARICTKVKTTCVGNPTALSLFLLNYQMKKNLVYLQSTYIPKTYTIPTFIFHENSLYKHSTPNSTNLMIIKRRAFKMENIYLISVKAQREKNSIWDIVCLFTLYSNKPQSSRKYIKSFRSVTTVVFMYSEPH